jgi:hypothetical protein
MNVLTNSSTKPYLLRDALELAILALRREEIDEEWVRALEDLRDQIRPRPTDGVEWFERVGRGTYRMHRVMLVFHDCADGERWDQYVWPDEALDALNVHMREAHHHPYSQEYADELVGHGGRFRHSRLTTGDADAQG